MNLHSIKMYIFSFFYRLIRSFIKNLTSLFQFFTLQQKDLESIIDFGDKGLIQINNHIGNFAFDFPVYDNIGVNVFDMHFKSPLVSASFKSEKEILEIWLRLGLGGVTYKTILKEKRTGNIRPRLQQLRLERSACLINALGLPGEGIDNFVKYLNDSPLGAYGCPIGISIGGEDINEYKYNFTEIHSGIENNKSKNYYYELNISCPNTDSGTCIGDDLNSLENLTDFIRIKTNTVISIKISPDWDNSKLIDIGDIIRSRKSIFVNAGNTQLKSLDSLGYRKNLLQKGSGGISGVALLPRTLEMTRLFHKQGVVVMATGGISTYDHVLAAKEAGASLFGMATSLIMDPYCIPKINYSLSTS